MNPGGIVVMGESRRRRPLSTSWRQEMAVRSLFMLAIHITVSSCTGGAGGDGGGLAVDERGDCLAWRTASWGVGSLVGAIEGVLRAEVGKSNRERVDGRKVPFMSTAMAATPVAWPASSS